MFFDEDEASDRTGKVRKSSMGIGLEKKLNKIYPPNSRIDDVFKGNDITFLTNEYGEPITLFIGKRSVEGKISGECFYRRIKSREEGKIKESHWDRQGKVLGK